LIFFASNQQLRGELKEVRGVPNNVQVAESQNVEKYLKLN
jgi:hypothetical protein